MSATCPACGSRIIKVKKQGKRCARHGWISRKEVQQA